MDKIWINKNQDWRTWKEQQSKKERKDFDFELILDWKRKSSKKKNGRHFFFLVFVFCWTQSKSDTCFTVFFESVVFFYLLTNKKPITKKIALLLQKLKKNGKKMGECDFLSFFFFFLSYLSPINSFM